MRKPYNVPKCFIRKEILDVCSVLENLPKDNCYFDCIANNVDRLANLSRYNTNYIYEFETYFNVCVNMKHYFEDCTTLSDYFEETLAYAIKEIIVCDNLTNICFNMLSKHLDMDEEILLKIAEEMSVDDCPQDLIERAIAYEQNNKDFK